MKKYFCRHIESRILRMNEKFKMLLVTGARQVGKSTVLSHCGKARSMISLDTVMVRSLAKDFPESFLVRHKSPVIIQEIQKAPELLSYIKEDVDASDVNGTYWLTQSQKTFFPDGLATSLAGRAAVLRLMGLSTREIFEGSDTTPFLPTPDFVAKRRETKEVVFDIDTVFHRIWQGSYPRLCLNSGVADTEWTDFYACYVDTFITRDIVPMRLHVNEYTFIQFIQTLATRIGQELKLSDIADNIGVSQPTTKKWLSILLASGLIYLLPPYFKNTGKQIRRASKIYFTDTGLAAWFAGWPNISALRDGAMKEAFFENHVVLEILKSWRNAGIEPQMYFYRDKGQREIDVLIAWQNKLHPVEIKLTGSPSKAMIKKFDVIAPQERGAGALVCLATDDRPITQNDWVIPVGYL